TIFREENTDNIKKFLEENQNFSVMKIEIPENISGEFDELGGFFINYKEEILDNFYIVKMRKDK
ncbi:MAG: 16S rRNA (cytosine(967)-C(5))-methyltransferase RsmB, partial [Cetobacterium sp.]